MASEARGGVPLWVRILIGVAAGAIVGQVLGARAAPLGEVALLVIKLLKALATPLILFAVLDAFLRTRIPPGQGVRLVALSLLNAAVAIALGLGVANLWHAGTRWPLTQATPPTGGPTLDLLESLRRLVPESLVEPFAKNNVIPVVLLALLVGAALRRLEVSGSPSLERPIAIARDLVHVAFRVLVQALEWVVAIVPIAVFGIVAQMVGKTGFAVLRPLALFLATVLVGLVLHAGAWYAVVVWRLARRSPLAFWEGAADAIVTALSCGSSLATLPVTLRCLDENLRVAPGPARLAACVGTNLNHDGIILYEAAAALFVAQAYGYPLGLGQQLAVAASAVLAGVGIAGVPEAGLITLPLVLGAAGLPDAVAVAALPLILPVDWIIGRFRAATNVMSDMTVALVLDRYETKG